MSPCFASRCVSALAGLLLLGGCGDRLVNGSFLGDAALQVHGFLAGTPQAAARPLAGAIWLGYSALYNRSLGIETRTLPLSATQFPAAFVCDVLEAPPSTGQYQTASSFLIPSFLRVARLILFDDLDGDGRFTIDEAGQLLPPDRLLGRSDSHVLLFISQPPEDPESLNGKDAILANWQDAFRGYHIVELNPNVVAPNLSGQVVDKTTSVRFSISDSAKNF